MKLIKEVSKQLVGKYAIDENMYKVTMFLDNHRTKGSGEQYFFAKVFDKVFDKYSIKVISRVVIARNDKVEVSFKVNKNGKKALRHLFNNIDVAWLFNEVVGEVYD